MPKNRQYYRKTKYPDKVAEPKSLVFVRIFLFCSVGIKIQYFPTAPLYFLHYSSPAFLAGQPRLCHVRYAIINLSISPSITALTFPLSAPVL